MPSEPVVFVLGFAPDALTRFERRRGPGLLVFWRHPDGRITVNDFPEEVDIRGVGDAPPGLARIERGRLYITASNGEAVYVAVGPSPRGTRYGRLYQRMVEG